MDVITSTARELEAETIATRRDLHRHPELGFEEHRTSALIADRLEALGLDVRRGVGGTGVVALLDTGRPGKTVLLRADMDALPIETQLTTDYASEHPGAMHACGHDGHTAILLSVAEALRRHEDHLRGRVLFVFQPAEERLEGARAMLDDGALDGVRPDVSTGLHLISDFEVGTVHARVGATMAATDFFEIEVSGSGGHAAKPHQNRSPVAAAAHLVGLLHGLVGSEVAPTEPAVLGVTSIQGGNTKNVVPTHATLMGTLRTFEADTRSTLKRRLEEVAAGVALATSVETHVNWSTGTPAVVNDHGATEVVRRVARDSVGADRVFEAAPRTSGEDMALWLQAVPGCYFFVGTRNPERGLDHPHHHPRFDIDEAALPLGVELLTKTAIALSRG